MRTHEVTERIKSYILDNRLKPGDPLPTEGALCDALGASRSSVREAIKTLHALDIVDVRHGHGTYVGHLSLSALVEGLTFRGLLSPDDDFEVLADLVDVRELIERGMAERIIAALDPGHLDALDALVTEMEGQDARGEDQSATDRAFHALLMEPLGNDLIRQLASAFWDVYRIVAPELEGMDLGDVRKALASHRHMVAAARAGDAAAFVTAVGRHYAPMRARITRARAQIGRD